MPHCPQDSSPAVGQSADSAREGTTPLSLSVIVFPCPDVAEKTLFGKLLEGIPQSFGTRSTEHDGKVLTASLGYWSGASTGLQTSRGRKVSPAVSYLCKQSCPKDWPSSREALKDTMILVLTKQSIDLSFIGSDVSLEGCQLSKQSKEIATPGSDCPRIG